MTAERLLLVEDDATTREVLTLLLEAEGWQVQEAESGEAAVEALQTTSAAPDVILCDLHLPGLQGAELAAALRPLAGGATLLAMSASDASAIDRSAYDDLLRKPLDTSAVRRAWKQATATLQHPFDDTHEVSGHAIGNPDATGDLAVIAPAILLTLQKQMGTKAKELYAFALADAGDRLRRMEESIAKNDDTTFRKEAHALKGSAGMIGAERLAALAAAAESSTTVTLEGSSDKTVHRMQLACNEIHLMLETLFPM